MAKKKKPKQINTSTMGAQNNTKGKVKRDPEEPSDRALKAIEREERLLKRLEEEEDDDEDLRW